MNVSEIYGDLAARGADFRVGTQESGADSWFRAGAILEGTVTKMGPTTTTVSFERGTERAAVSSVATEKKELDFPNEQVANAYVGEKRQYEVMSTDDGHIRLKDLSSGGNGGGNGGGSAHSFLNVESNAVQVLETLSENLGIHEKTGAEPLKRLTGDDYDSLSKEGMSLEKYKSERLERAMERIKTGRAMKEVLVDETVEANREKAADIESMSEGFTSNGVNKRIIDTLKEADLPVTEENIAGVMVALEMSGKASELNDNSVAYLLKNNLEPTIDNIYKSFYSGSFNGKRVPDSVWREMTASVENVLWQAKGILDSENAYGTEDGSADKMPTMEDARWLLERDIPVTPEMVVMKMHLNEFSLSMVNDSLSARQNTAIRAAVRAMAQDKAPGDGLLIDPQADNERIADANVKSVIRRASTISDMAIRYVVRGETNGVNNGVVSLSALSDAEELIEEAPELTAGVLAGSMTSEEISAKMKLEEIRLKLTLESGRQLMAKGINLGGDSLDKVVAGLRDLEKNYYRALRQEVGSPKSVGAKAAEAVTNEDSEIDIAAETKEALNSLSKAPAALVGETLNDRSSLSLKELGERALAMRERLIGEGTDGVQEKVEVRSSVSAALDYYEASATQVRGDLGDNIRKAFEDVDGLIRDTGLTPTEATKRAVRILGYNNMPITKDNIEGIKAWDARLNSVLKKMTPPVVMSMVRGGVNPLEKTLDELEHTADAIIKEHGQSSEKKYSEFLVELEENGKITPAEREAYIGVYRLLYAATKTEGAALGAAFKAGIELNLKNLLMSERTAGTHINASADDTTKQSSSRYTNSISDQLANAFSKISTSEIYDYNMRIVEDALDKTSSETWRNALENENIENLSLEQLSEKLNSADNNIDSTEAADRLRDTMIMNVGTRKFLNAFGIDDSFTNINAANAEFAADDEGGSVIAPVTKDELMEAFDTPVGPEELLWGKVIVAQEGIGNTFMGNIDGVTSRSLTEQLDRLGLIRQLGEGGQYRFMVEDESGLPAKINLTIICNTGNAGTVSMQLTTSTYTVKADLRLTVMMNEYGAGALGGENAPRSFVSGFISSDDVTNVAELEQPMESFVSSLREMGYNADGISLRTTHEASSRFNGQLAVNKLAETNPEGRRNGSANALYRVAKNLVAKFL